ncbi:sodium/potassium/calcium exchanger 5-like [Tubulanus polymorphus]|uniref:sodium/potassium/calcium exchanger 5-like n=1 Tax=Tubulanus polymorphus TaxID=672921 RepID=UPI003DA28C67
MDVERATDIAVIYNFVSSPTEPESLDKATWKSRRQRRRYGVWKLALVLLSYIGFSCFYGFIYSIHSANEPVNTETTYQGRILLSDKFNCSPRSIEEFPPDFFTEEQRKAGGVFVHFLIAFYMCGALAIVCDDYFVSSLEGICERTKLKPDVAGATFMAAGSSAPELATAVIGVFIAKSDVGVGTIVGSAVFNILCIVAICGLFAGAVIQLSWWPLFRDTFCYMISVVALIVIIYDEEVHWYEGVTCLALYLLYIILMYFNTGLERFMTSHVRMCGVDYSYAERRVSSEENTERTALLSSDKTVETETTFTYNISNRYKNDSSTADYKGDFRSFDAEFESPWTIPESFLSRCFFVSMAPVNLCLFITVPDCRRPGIWRHLFLLTFTMSVVWIGVFSYVLVWMVTVIGDTLGIPDTVMGLTLLAAGTSVPDALAGLFVARDGLGDMAVSNAVGSNIFDILVCLGLPWFLRTVLIDPNDIVPINSSGLLYSSIALLSTVFLLIIVVILNRWKMDKKLGVTFLIIYAVVISLACLFELNIFGDFNPPQC